MSEATEQMPACPEQEQRARLVRAAEEFVTVMDGKAFQFTLEDAHRLAFFSWRLGSEARCPIR